MQNFQIMSFDKYQKLREELLKNKKWPLLYMFKFIAPNQEDNVKKVVAILPKNGDISYKHTKNLKYVSITCKVKMASAESIININAQISEIEGVMSL